MKLCDYQILEYTASELRTHGKPFIVVLRMPVLDSYTLAGYVLRGWRKKIEATVEKELGDIEILLKDLRHHCHSQNSVTSFFEGLDGLSVGPIRAIVSGSCSIHDLDGVIRVFFEETQGSPSWQEHFH